MKVLCWFCGEWRIERSVWHGHCLGRMVYSSDLNVSAPNETTNSDEIAVQTHLQRDRVVICQPCVERFLKDVKVHGEYLIHQLENRDKAINEALNYDVDLVKWHERRHLFNCWFEHYSCVSNDHLVRSKPLIELFDCGWRLQGATILTEPQLGAFLARNADPPCLPTVSFREHIESHIEVKDPVQLPKLGGIRAGICDLTLIEFGLTAIDRFKPEV